MLSILPAPSLAPLTTLRIGGSALAEIRLEHPADFEALPAAIARLGGEPRVLGGGSNLLVAEGELPLTLIRPLCGMGSQPAIVSRDTTSDGQSRVLIRAGAGLRMPALLNWCAKNGLSGLEGLAGVPGRLGGAIAMNAGAHGSCLADVLKTVTVFTPERGLHSLNNDGWSSAYRTFSLAEHCAWFVVVEAVLELRSVPSSAVRQTMTDCLSRKKTAQPLTLHTAGCVFKNPPGLSAGKILDEAGLRGKRNGPVYFTDKHANFLAHDGQKQEAGAFNAATELICEARETVARRTGINLELEIKVWPCPLY